METWKVAKRIDSKSSDATHTIEVIRVEDYDHH